MVWCESDSSGCYEGVSNKFPSVILKWEKINKDIIGIDIILIINIKN